MIIKVASPSFSKDQYLRQRLLASFPDSVFNEEQRRFSPEELIEYLDGADGAIIGTETVNQHVLDLLGTVKILAKYGVGLDNIDQDYARRKGIAIGWSGGVNRRSVAEQALAFMIGLCRNLFQTSFLLKQGTWKKEGGVQLSGRKVGIIGCGFIGTELLRLLRPFGCELYVCDLLDKSETCREFNASQVDLNTLLATCEVISLHVPLSKETHYLINAETLERMNPEAILVNTSRGKVVEQEALKQALKQGKIHAAALDVFEEEPPTDQEFLNLPNLMITPHIGGNAKEAVEAMGDAAIGHLKTFFGV